MLYVSSCAEELLYTEGFHNESLVGSTPSFESYPILQLSFTHPT